MADTPKPKNKQTLTILTVVGAAIIVWLFLKTELGRKLLQALKNLFGGNSDSNNSAGGNTVVNDGGDKSWLDSLLNALKDATAPFTINIPDWPGYTPSDYDFNLGNNDYSPPNFDTSSNSTSNNGSGCSFCMKTPEGLSPISPPAPAPTIYIPRNLPTSYGGTWNTPYHQNITSFTGFGNFG